MRLLRGSGSRAGRSNMVNLVTEVTMSVYVSQYLYTEWLGGRIATCAGDLIQFSVWSGKGSWFLAVPAGSKEKEGSKRGLSTDPHASPT